MATVTVSSDSDYSALGVSSNDLVIVNNSARLTIDTSTVDVRRWDCITDGEFFVENLTDTPRFMHVGSTGTSNPRIRLEAGGRLTTRGKLIEVGTSDGTGGQFFTLPLDGVEKYDLLGGVWIDDGQGGHIQFSRATDGITAALFGDENLGRQFEHDTLLNRVVFGDGINGWIPPAGRKIYVPSIQLKNTNSAATVQVFDLALSGRLDLEFTSISCQSQAGGGAWNTDFDNGAGQRFYYVCIDRPSSTVNFNINAGLLDLDMVILHTDRELIMSSCAVALKVGTLYIYNEHASNNDYSIEANNIPGGSFGEITIIEPKRAGVNASRAAMLTNGTDIEIEKLIVGSGNTGFYCSSGAANVLVRKFIVNAKGSRTQDTGTSKTAAVRCSNATDITVLNIESALQDEADGAQSHKEAILQATSGSQRVRIVGVDWWSISSVPTDHLVNDQARDTLVANVDWHGQFGNRVHELGTTSSGLVTKNIKALDSQSSTISSEVGFASRYERTYVHNMLATAVGTGTDSISHLTYRTEGDTSAGRLESRMSPVAMETDKVEIVNQTGKISFSQNNRLYIEKTGDIVRMRSNSHAGVLGAVSVSKWGVNTSQFSVEFRLRRPEGAWGTKRVWSSANINTAISELSANTSNSIEIEWEIEKTTDGFSGYLYGLYANVNLDAGYSEPVISLPSLLSLTGLQADTEVRVYDAANTIVEIAGIESVSGEWSVALDREAYPIVIVHIISLGWQMIRLSDINLSNGDVTVPVQQQIDRQYSNA